jgi:hypothetical protein
MDNFYDKKEYSISDVLLLIENETEESIHLDFKEANALDKSDGKKKDISKDVTSFANSDGGIIIYGIKEQNHKAHSLSYIDGNTYTKEWLEQLINSTIQRRIPDIAIFPIRHDNKIEQTIYLVKIPKSLDAPHLSKDKRFYKRFNFESVPMEEYEIRQLYGRKLKSKLVLGGWSIGRTDKDDEDDEKMTFKFEVSVINDGDVMEKDYKVNVYFNNFNKHLNISWNTNTPNYDYTWFEQGRVKVSSHSPAPVYPNERVNAIRFNIEIPKAHLIEAFQDIKIEVALYYEHGEDKMEGDLTDLIDKISNRSTLQIEE